MGVVTGPGAGSDHELVGEPGTPEFRQAMRHRMLNELTSIIGFTENLTRRLDGGTATPEQLRERLGRIRETAMRLVGQVEELAE